MFQVVEEIKDSQCSGKSTNVPLNPSTRDLHEHTIFLDL